MFDEISQDPEDMFAQTDANAPQVAPPTMSTSSTAPQSAPGTAQPVSPVMQQPSVAPSRSIPAQPGARAPFPWKVVVLVIAILSAITLAFFLSMRILNSRTPVTPTAPSETEQMPTQTTAPAATTPAPVAETVPGTAPEATVPVVAPVESTVDTDKDGLSDTQEATLGTNPNNPDTDADGLFDKEEVDVYRTNPLNSDTDGDTYKDGDEVKNGYNPNGPGKLLQVPQK